MVGAKSSSQKGKLAAVVVEGMFWSASPRSNWEVLRSSPAAPAPPSPNRGSPCGFGGGGAAGTGSSSAPIAVPHRWFRRRLRPQAPPPACAPKICYRPASPSHRPARARPHGTTQLVEVEWGKGVAASTLGAPRGGPEDGGRYGGVAGVVNSGNLLSF
jgi:hypothetical protein